MRFLPAPYSREGFTSVLDQVSQGSDRRFLFGQAETVNGLIVPAAALVLNDEQNVAQSITTIEFSTRGRIHSVRRAILFFGDIVLHQGSLATAEAGITPEAAQEILGGELSMTVMAGSYPRQEALFQRIADVALQLNHQQV